VRARVQAHQQVGFSCTLLAVFQRSMPSNLHHLLCLCSSARPSSPPSRPCHLCVTHLHTVSLMMMLFIIITLTHRLFTWCAH
jgi:hypothetical protein